MQISASEFSAEPRGHSFVLRVPLAKATANKCAACAEDIRSHARHEVTDQQLLAVLSTQDDGRASVILPGELAVGSYKAALAVGKQRDRTSVVLNCAGKRLHEFLPLTRREFDRLRAENRLYDLEWEDSESFEIPWEDVAAALEWSRARVADGSMVTVTCAQGKSRSGTMAAAYVMAKLKLSAADGIALVRSKRPLVEPNPAFVRRLTAFEARLRQQPVPTLRDEAQLRAAFGAYDADGSGGLSVSELRVALVRSGGSAGDAKALVSEYAKGDELTVDEFVEAWRASGAGPIVVSAPAPRTGAGAAPARAREAPSDAAEEVT